MRWVAAAALRRRRGNEAERSRGWRRALLHAAALSFAHPVTGVPLALKSEWPDDLRPALAEAAADANLLAERNPLQYLASSHPMNEGSLVPPAYSCSRNSGVRG